MDGDAKEHVSLRSGQRSVSIRVPSTDIDNCISVSLWRVLLTIFSIVLVVTDIPRTGLTLSLTDYYERVGPDAVASWGPYEYHVAHLRATDLTAINASCDGEPLTSLEVWAYKFDTLSIALRAVAERLRVAEYPPCVLYHEPCKSPSVQPETVFPMLDGLVTALQREYFPQPNFESRPFAFVTKSNWVDRLHQYVFRFLTKGPEARFHSVFHRSSRGRRLDTRGLCDTHAIDEHAFRTESKPVFCDHQIRWKCDHPIEPTGDRRIAIWDHIAIRVEDLQRRYPDLELDLTIFVSTVVEQAHSDRHVIRSVSMSTDALEVTTVVRGQRCTRSQACTTVFIDDYRYERVLLESDADLWKSYLWILRGLSQSYVWLRVVLLVCGCYRARAAERNNRHRSLFRAVVDVARIIVKIPGHTIVYGSWLPVLGYALAHHFDSCLIHMIGEYAWSSIGGFFDFRPVDYILSASIQMRNLWMNMIGWKLALGAWSVVTTRCQSTTYRERRGVLTFRPGWIGLISWLTTFSLMRSVTFRDTRIVSMVELPRHTAMSALQRLTTYRNYSDYGIRFDLKASFATSVLVITFALCFSAFVKVLTGRTTSMLVCRSFYVPLSAGRLWLRSAIDTYWSVKLASAELVRLMSMTLVPAQMDKAKCASCSWSTSPLHWKSVQGCVVHEQIFDVQRRTRAIWSMVRLTNIVNMTDPIALLRLYVIGKPLYVYRVNAGHDQPTYQVLLPTSPSESGSTSGLVLVGVVDSRDVPWDVILNCG